jgi:hypothetical protein
MPAPGSVLAGAVKSYVSQWDSTTGWGPAVATMAASVIALFAPVPPGTSALFRFDASLYLKRAAGLAEQAAQTIDADVTNPANGYLLSPSYKQVIQLVGHSRGGAVNARVSQLLAQQGYTVAQYTSLDGYSTDWPFPSGMLGDISIQNTATATRLVNYRVQAGLAQYILNWASAATGVSFSQQDQSDVIAFAADWRAPIRPGFENMILPGKGADSPSNHLNIVKLYSDLTSPFIYDNFEGLNRNNVTPGPVATGAFTNVTMAAAAQPLAASVTPRRRGPISATSPTDRSRLSTASGARSRPSGTPRATAHSTRSSRRTAIPRSSSRPSGIRVERPSSRSLGRFRSLSSTNQPRLAPIPPSASTFSSIPTPRRSAST